MTKGLNLILYWAVIKFLFVKVKLFEVETELSMLDCFKYLCKILRTFTLIFVNMVTWNKCYFGFCIELLSPLPGYQIIRVFWLTPSLTNYKHLVLLFLRNAKVFLFASGCFSFVAFPHNLSIFNINSSLDHNKSEIILKRKTFVLRF